MMVEIRVNCEQNSLPVAVSDAGHAPRTRTGACHTSRRGSPTGARGVLYT